MKKIIYILIAIFLIGCAASNMTTSKQSRISVQVDSYGNDSGLEKRNCFLYAADTLINTNDLQYEEFYGYLKKIFTYKGYNVVESIESANIIIFFNYGISDPKTYEYTKSIPVWGQTGVTSTTTTGNAYVDPYTNNVTYRQKTTNRPTYGVKGYRTVSGNYTAYLRYINFIAFDFEYYSKTKKEKRIWQTSVTSEGNSDDLRYIFPYMLVGAYKYIGNSSGEQKEIILYENDANVQKLKGQ